MRASFHLADLTRAEAPLAFPLVRATWPETELERWLDLVEFFDRDAARGGGGVIAVQNPAGYIYGVLAYRVEYGLQSGRLLDVPLFAAVDFANSQTTVRALLDGADMRAVALGCNGLLIRLDARQAGLAARLAAFGLTAAGALHWQDVDTARAPN